MAIVGAPSSEIAGIRRELEEIKRILDELQPQLERAPRQLETFKQLERVAFRYLTLVRRAGLPENAEELIRVGTRIIVVFRQMQIAGTMLFAGPVGVLLGIATLALAHLTLMEGY